jgi:Fe-S cluster assembly ATP-binding protein
VSFQAPPDVPGVKNNLFIRTALNAQREAQGRRRWMRSTFWPTPNEGAKSLGLPDHHAGPPRQ